MAKMLGISRTYISRIEENYLMEI
ncbi:helix-turn-helix domain-containing protein [Ruminiclostridium herbifermentans]|uniref:Helix-turn-helix domain-containing protein n=1 Tax=Ruminiclostridium herbifermentans TaxID=2488810 RepID=A0A4U7JG45_9FIRM|nr:helix-turn-helix domain-containing protein [Ruminiclostridium herbifermentans]